MKSSIVLSTFLVVFCLAKHITAQETFELPSELTIKYFNITLDDIYQACDRMDVVLGVRGRTLDEAKLHAGESMIEHIAELMRGRPSVTDQEWNRVMEERCRTNDFFYVLLNTSGENAYTCILRGMHVNKDHMLSLERDYIDEFCRRVERLARAKVAN